jgi:hypothetical protein
MILSLFRIVRHSYHPHTAVLVNDEKVRDVKTILVLVITAMLVAVPSPANQPGPRNPIPRRVERRTPPDQRDPTRGVVAPIALFPDQHRERFAAVAVKMLRGNLMNPQEEEPTEHI